ncbi:hypothetical protein [Cohnella sp. 56]|uniref:hypothetical protein n=1 Tax=Cohnella sp. 56 TaxID=3113722 RepID=UPI0030EA760F
MKRMPYQRPTDYYDERVKSVDEQLCKLLQERKRLSPDNPGYPPFAYIEQWAARCGLYDEHLKALFGLLLHEDTFKPAIEPAGFVGYVPIHRSVEHAGCLYTLAAARQYDNASVVTLHIDRHEMDAPDLPAHFWMSYELELGEGFECRTDQGGSSGSHAYCDYVVSPALPVDMSGMAFVFRRRPGPQESCDPAHPPDQNVAFEV